MTTLCTCLNVAQVDRSLAALLFIKGGSTRPFPILPAPFPILTLPLPIRNEG